MSFGPVAQAQPAPVPATSGDTSPPTADNAVMLTVFFLGGAEVEM